MFLDYISVEALCYYNTLLNVFNRYRTTVYLTNTFYVYIKQALKHFFVQPVAHFWWQEDCNLPEQRQHFASR